MANIVLIEINESDVENIGVPFTMYGVYHVAPAKLRAAWAELNESKKQTSELYKKMDKMLAVNDE